MEPNEQNLTPSERRKQTRWSVYNFIRATATISNCPAGLLADISNEGAQIILPCDCRNVLAVGKNVSVFIKTSLEQCNLNLTAQVKSIAVSAQDDTIRVGLLFIGIENVPEAKEIIKKICEYGQKLQSVKID
ncbi:MAG: PilZ domain-containing protein [Phycisphaerae bacterium]